MAINSILDLDIQIEGDGVSALFTFDFTKGPFNANVGGNNPTGVVVRTSSQMVTATLSGTRVTLNFATAPALGNPSGAGGAAVTLGLLFPGI